MTLPDRDTVQRVGRPQFQALLDRQGRAVVIRRPGVPDEEVRALLVPVSRQGPSDETDAPRFGLLPWKAFFRHDVQGVRAPGFTLIAPLDQGQPPVTLTPTSPTVDLADQGVALMVICAPATDRTRVSQLTFTLPGVGLVKDGRGNSVPASGESLTVAARLTASTDPRIRETVGADAAALVFVGRWGTLENPLVRPAGVGWGSTCPLELDGQPGTLTIALAWPDEDLALERQFGSRFLATWRTV